MNKFKFDINLPDPCGIIGKMFGKLKATGFVGHIRDKRGRWRYIYKVKCSCRAGTEFSVDYNSLSSGNTTSCCRCKHGDPVIVGDKFHSLTVVGIIPPDPEHKFTRAECTCDCGNPNKVIASVIHLRSGKVKSCGNPAHYIKNEYSGRLKLGMQEGTEIEVLEISATKRTKKGERVAICKCHHVNPITEKECGKIFEATVSNVLTGNTKSCGCTHNLYPDEKTSRLGHKWFAMRYRCNRESCKSYPDYGGRGIDVTREWDETRDGRIKFIKDVVENKDFELGQSIDRIENDEGYCLKNIRFTDQVMQNNNKRNNHKVTVDGTTLTLSQWAHLLHLNRVMFTNKFRAVVDEAEYIRRLMRKEVSIFDKLPYDLCKKRKERCDKGIKRQTKEPNMKQEEKDELVHNLHSHFGDASDPYAARAAKIIADELDKPDNKADLDRLIAARKAWTDAKIPRTKEGDKMLEDLFAKESAIIDELVNKFCPDNWKKNDLKWP